MKYKDYKPIKTKSCSAWLINFTDTTKIERKLELWNDKAIIIDVINSAKNYFPNRKFTVMQVEIGTFNIDRIINCYNSDGRKVDQDLTLQL